MAGIAEENDVAHFHNDILRVGFGRLTHAVGAQRNECLALLADKQ
jgi:hypothetical protein